MQTRAPRTSRILIGALFALSSVGLTIWVWVSFGGTLPLQPKGYEVRILFANASNLATNADVRMSGANVGKVTAVSHKGLSTQATLTLQSRYAPLPADALAIIRNKTLLGETYIALTPGTRSAPKLKHGGLLPTRNVQEIQPIDQVLGSFDAPTRAKFKTFVQEFATAVRGRGEDVNDALGNLAPTAEDLNVVARIVDRQRDSLKLILRDGSGVLQAVGRRRADLRRLVTAGDQVFTATAARDRQLTDTVRALPRFLTDLRATMAVVDKTAEDAAPALHELIPAAPLIRPALDAAHRLAPQLRGTFRELAPVLPAITRAVPAVGRMVTASAPTFDAVADAGVQLNPLLKLISLYKNEIVAGFANGAAAFQGSYPTAGGSPLHYVRGIFVFTNELLFGYAKRPATNRHNPYLKPGALQKLATGLDAFSCANTANPTPVPVLGLGGPPPCHEQGPWGFQNLTQSYPHVQPSK